LGVHLECLHQRGSNRSVSIEGVPTEGIYSNQGSPSEGLQPRVSIGRVPTDGLLRRGSYRVSPSEGFRPRVSIGGVPTKGLHQRSSNQGSLSEGFQSACLHQRGSNQGSLSEGFQSACLHQRGSNRGSSSEGFHCFDQSSEMEEIGGSYGESDNSIRGFIVSIGGVSLYSSGNDTNALSFSRPLIKELGEEADALPTIAPAKAPYSRNHIKSSRTKDTSTKDVPSDRGFEGFSEGKDATTNKLNEDANPNGMFLDDGFDDDDDSPN
ncbi:hypothetical protein Tco_1322513, partial [Tanacetum coccineum]